VQQQMKSIPQMQVQILPGLPFLARYEVRGRSGEGSYSQNPSHTPAISGCPHLEGSMHASRHNEDASEEHHEIADAKQAEARLVC
jgi:hypothetical protein